MASSYEKQAQQESANQKILREWISQRIAAIHKKVTVHDVLRKNGIALDHEDRAVQFSCPFHGRDEKPSARAYPESGNGPSHAWCFVCQERWDAISIYKKFSGAEKKFTRILSEIEQSFGLEPVPFPDGLTVLTQDDQVPEEDLTTFHKLTDACERRLLEAKPVYELHSYLSAASLLERVSARVVDRRMPLSEGERLLRALLGKIGLKMRSCPAG